jgi:hypothetical protein
VSIGLIDILHDEPTPLRNVNTFSDAFPIACSATAPTTVIPVNPMDMNPVTLANTMANTCAATICVPHDLSALRSSAPNPWESLCHRHYSCYPHTPHQFTHQRQYLPIYPTNTYLHTAPTPKPPTSIPVCVFKMVTHLHSGGVSLAESQGGGKYLIEGWSDV